MLKDFSVYNSLGINAAKKLADNGVFADLPNCRLECVIDQMIEHIEKQ